MGTTESNVSVVLSFKAVYNVFSESSMIKML